MKNIGIWIDKKKAHIVTLDEQKEQLRTIKSSVDDYHPSGGSGTKFKGGPQDVVQDSKYLEREKHQLKDYFKEIASVVEKGDKIVIYGPAETSQKFRKELEENYSTISQKISAIKKADSMTENQVIALIKNYFN